MNFSDTLLSAKTTVRDCTEFAVNGITNICKLYGPRPCGDESEKKAQETMLEEMKAFSDEVRRETFKANPDAFMSFVPIAGSCCIGAAAINLLAAKKKSKAALGSVALLGAGVSSLVGEFLLYKKMLDPLFKEKESGNVIAVRKATGETKRRIIISGHTDSAPEWTYTYKLGSHGSVMVLAPAITGLVYTAATSAVALTKKNSKTAKKMALGQLAFFPAYGALYKFTNNKRYVDGANDDLSGCYLASAVLKYLSDNDISFENTEVIAMLAGGEEAGLRGSKAFFEAHPEYKNDGVETVFISADTIRDEDYMMIYERDMTGMVKNDKRVCSLLKRAGEKQGLDIPVGTIPLGSTDAAAASQAGIPAASIVAMDPAPADYYHTRRDTADILNPDCIEKILGVLLEAVFDFDENGID
ncbi:MAG: M20/M25/M40 family metallo-hydrolase [Ruminococcaceae bacterium]|nr:M20/M25/M40 family metallo-hydrolase [Oscillospiraceae bacterium]